LVLLSVIVNDPENEEPDCVSCQVIVPGPEESLAFPVQVPVTLAGDGADGLELPPPPQAVMAATDSTTDTMRAAQCRARLNNDRSMDEFVEFTAAGEIRASNCFSAFALRASARQAAFAATLRRDGRRLSYL
jgi:hypothetical protein